ncbi:uncharacterized protein ACHE_70691S, partial [Aspergillus chevalieri]
MPVRFPHIHGGDHGIRAITVDMCLKWAPARSLRDCRNGSQQCGTIAGTQPTLQHHMREAHPGA